MQQILLGNHQSIEKIRELVAMVSETAFNVLIMGETGTGKEVVARLLHATSPRRGKRFVKVNCGALPYTLLESELFGYERGAFTGADKFKPGKFEIASGGVIFLDEIGDMPFVLQSKLLEVLQGGGFTRLGGTKEVKVDAWVIAATNHNLEKDIREGRFREDLYYRLNIIRIIIPPLRERKEDIELLANHFIQTHKRALGIKGDFTLDEDLFALFHEYHWPGNVRELSSTILRLLVGENPEVIRNEFLRNMRADGLLDNGHQEIELPKDIGLSTLHKVNLGSDGLRPLKDLKEETTRYVEEKVIRHALALSGWNKRKAAQLLKISYKALFYKMKDLGIESQPKVRLGVKGSGKGSDRNSDPDVHTSPMDGGMTK